MRKKLLSLFLAFLLLQPSVFAAYRKPRGWGKFRPVIGSQVNWGDPITQGLVRLWVFNEAGGNRVVDLVQGNQGTNVSGNGLWNGSIHGQGMNFNGTSAIVADSTTTRYWGRAKPNSYFMITQALSTATGQHLMGSYNTGSWSPAHDQSLLQISSVGKITYHWDGNNNSNSLQNSKTFAAGDLLFISASSDGSDSNNALLYVNGVRASGNTFGGACGCTFWENITIGGDNAYNFNQSQAYGNYYNGNVYLVAVWSRMLKDEEHQRLYENPYLLVQSPKWILGDPAAAAGGAVTSAFTFLDNYTASATSTGTGAATWERITWS